MNPVLIFWPMIAVVFVPIAVLFLNAIRKAHQRKSGSIHPDAPIDNRAWSMPVLLTSNSLANQFQLPVLCYGLAFIVFNINGVSALNLSLAWVFATSRWVHAFVHVTSNNIPLRLSFFGIGAIALLLLFFVTIIQLMSLS